MPLHLKYEQVLHNPQCSLVLNILDQENKRIFPHLCLGLPYSQLAFDTIGIGRVVPAAASVSYWHQTFGMRAFHQVTFGGMGQHHGPFATGPSTLWQLCWKG